MGYLSSISKNGTSISINKVHSIGGLAVSPSNRTLGYIEKDGETFYLKQKVTPANSITIQYVEPSLVISHAQNEYNESTGDLAFTGLSSYAIYTEATGDIAFTSK